MSYLEKHTLSNLILAAMMIVVGYCLQWAGVATMTERMVEAVHGMILSSYEWSASMATYVHMAYAAESWWWGILSGFFLIWAAFMLVVVGGLYRFVSIRLAGVAAIAAIIATFSFAVPVRMADAFWTRGAGGSFISNPVDTKSGPPSGKARDTEHSTDTLANDGVTPSDVWSASEGSLGFFNAFGNGAFIYNLVRLIMIPFIIVLISISLLGSLRSRKTV